MTTRLIQRMALRLLSAGVFSYCVLTAAPAPAGEVDPGKARLEAIKVELALLNDASSYAQPLAVRVQGDGVEVRGTVASDAVRQRVLAIARRSCYLPVHDRIAVAGEVTRAAAPLVKTAHDRLVRELGAQADAIKIQPEAGKLKLTGRVRSVEDKLHASRTLRGLPGCAGLVNELEVKPDAGPSFTLVTHAADEAEPAPAAPAAEPAPAESRPAVEDAPAAPVATLPSGLPPARVAPVQAEPMEGWRSRSLPASAVFPQAVVKKPAPPAEPKLAPVAAPAPAPAVTQTPAPVLTEWPPAHRTGLVTPLPAGTLYQSHPVSHLSRSPAPPVAPPVAPPADLKPVAAMTPVVEAKPVAAVTPVVEAKTPVVETKPVPETKVEVVKKAVPTKSAVAAIVRKVKAASGSYAREVRGEVGADGVLAIHVYVTVGGEQMLTTRLFDVPELTESNVRLHVHLAK